MTAPVPDPPAKAAREHAIAAALDGADHRTHVIPAETGYIEVPVVTLDPGVLVYRLDNGRILAELRDAAEARGTTPEQLKHHGETRDVQALLHELLLAKARDPGGPIHHELAVHGQQTEPLLVQRDGVVLNGNRRLAAMRALHTGDPGRYAAFARVHAAVLPDELDAHALEFIEAALQMAPDLKLGYSWTNRRLKLRQHVRDLGRERVLAAYRFRDSAAIDTELAELALAEAYLDWIGEPGHLARVADAEDSFRALNEQLQNLGPPHLAAVWRTIGFAMLHAAPNLERRIAHDFPFTKPVPAAVRTWVPRTLAAERELAPPLEPGQTGKVDEDLAGRLRARLADSGDAVRTARAVMGLIDTLRGDQDRLLGTTRAVHHLRAARDALEALDPEQVPPAQHRRLEAEAVAVQHNLRALRDSDDRVRPLPRGRERRLPNAMRWFVRQIRRLRG